MPPNPHSPSPTLYPHTERASWHAADPSPLRSHSITELLHDPRPSSTPISVPPPPPPSPSLPVPASINEFTLYLATIHAPHKAFLAAREATLLPTSTNAPLIPDAYFSPTFTPADSPDLAALAALGPTPPLYTSSDVVALRATLASRASHLQAELHRALSGAAPQIAAAVDSASALRGALSETRVAAMAMASATAAVADAVSSDAPVTAALGVRRDNACVLRSALRRAARVAAAAEDAHLLVDAGDFPDAMRAVRRGRRALKARGGELERCVAVQGAAAELGRAVQRIDEGLREAIMALIGRDLRCVAEGEEQEIDVGVPGKGVKDLARLVARLGTSAQAHRAFLEDVRRELERDLEGVESVDGAASAARVAARKAALVHAVFTVEDEAADRNLGKIDVTGVFVHGGAHSGGVGKMRRDGKDGANDGIVDGDGDVDTRAACIGASEEDLEEIYSEEEEASAGAGWKELKLDRQRNRDNLRELYESILDLMCRVLDRFLGKLDAATCEFIVLMDNSAVDEANFFDETKGAVRFGDAMRAVDGLVHDLARIMLPDANKRNGGEGGKGAVGAAAHRGSPVNALRSKISERSIAFVSALAKAHSDSLTSALHAEKWTEVKIPLGVLRLVACVTGDSLPSFDEDPVGASPVSDDGRRFTSAVHIHEERYRTVGSGLRYVRSICAFALLVDKLPFASSEAARRGVELSRTFNSVAGRAILGASALQWAGLRSITARHLALASRTIALAVGIAPHISAPLQNAVSEKQVAVVGSLMMQTEKDMRDHHVQLIAKIMFIMMERLAAHEEALIALPWKKPLEMRRFETPSAYVATLSKEAAVLHRILWSILPNREVVDIFNKVFKAYGSHLSDAYGALDEVRPWVQQRIMADVFLLYERLSVLDVSKLDPVGFEPIEKLYQRFYVNHSNERQGAPGHGLTHVPVEKEPNNVELDAVEKSSLSSPGVLVSLESDAPSSARPDDSPSPPLSEKADFRVSESPPEDSTLKTAPQGLGSGSVGSPSQPLPPSVAAGENAVSVDAAGLFGPSHATASLDELPLFPLTQDADEQSLSSPVPSPRLIRENLTVDALVPLPEDATVSLSNGSIAPVPDGCSAQLPVSDIVSLSEVAIGHCLEGQSVGVSAAFGTEPNTVNDSAVAEGDLLGSFASAAVATNDSTQAMSSLDEAEPKWVSPRASSIIDLEPLATTSEAISEFLGPIQSEAASQDLPSISALPAGLNSIGSNSPAVESVSESLLGPIQGLSSESMIVPVQAEFEDILGSLGAASTAATAVSDGDHPRHATDANDLLGSLEAMPYSSRESSHVPAHALLADDFLESSTKRR